MKKFMLQYKQHVVIIIFFFFLGAGLSIVFAALPMTTKLSWTPPTTTVDGQPINADTAITDYKIYCGKSPGSYTITKNTGIVTIYNAIDIPLTTGVWYCVVTVFNKYGESGYSNEKMFDFDATLPGKPVIVNMN
jgi:hypothetical protein